MTNIRKKISELTALTSASLDTTIVGVDNGTTYKIELDVLADAVTSRVNILDRDRLQYLESVTSSFETKGRGIVSGSSQLTSSYDSRYVISGSITQTNWDNIANKPNGIVSQSTNLSSLNSFTSSQNVLNTAFQNGILSRVTTSSFNDFTASVADVADFVFTSETITNGAITLHATDSDIVLNADGDVYIGSANSGNGIVTDGYLENIIGDTTIINTGTGNSITDNLNNIINNRGIVSSSTQISNLGFVTGSYAYLTEFNSLTQSFNIISGSVVNITNAVDVTQLNNTTASLNSFTQSANTRLNNIELKTGSFVTTSSFNSYTESISTASLVTSITNLNSFSSSTNTKFSTLGSLTGSFATTGSNIFIGTETISGSLILSSSVPTSTTGGAGDRAGQIVFDANYIYYNTTTYVPQVAYTYTTISGSGANPSWTNQLYGATTLWIAYWGGFVGSAPVPTAGLTLSDGTNTRVITSVQSNATGFGASYILNFSGSINWSTLPTITAISQSAVNANWVKVPFNAITASTMVGGTISGSSQLTSSLDTRYLTIGGDSVISGSAQITSFGFVSGSYETTGRGIISGSSQLTSSYDGRYVQTGSFNTLSSSVDSRLGTLENSVITGSVNYVQVLGNQRSLSTTNTDIISASLTTSGNPVQILITGDANPTSATGQWTVLKIYRNGNAIGGGVQIEAANQNENQAYCLNVIDTPSTGTQVYSMRMVTNSGGTFQFGENTGPVLTAVELTTNTNLPSTNNTFTGTNTFNQSITTKGDLTVGTSSGNEGGQINMALAATNQTLTGSVNIDVYQNRIRFWEGGGNARGVSIDLSKAPNSVNAELLWKASGFVNTDVDVTLGNLKARIPSTGNKSLQLSTVSGTYSVYGSSLYSYNGVGAVTLNNGTPLNVTTTPQYLAAGYNFLVAGATDVWNIMDTSAGIAWRITMILGASYNNNMISIERLV